MNTRAFILGLLMWASAGPLGAVGTRVDVTIHGRDEGRALPVYQHEGRYYVVGRPGSEYQINVRNGTGAEVLTVVSVDGVNAVSGETANWAQTGYVLRASGSVDIRGWRKSLSRVAAFFFTEHDNSYAARTGRPDNVGVIGVAVFRKKPVPEIGLYPPPPARQEPFGQGGSGAAEEKASSRADSAAQPMPNSAERAPRDAAPGSGAALGSIVAPAGESNRLGTGHGRSEQSSARYTSFERASSAPDEVITIYYDSYRNLVARGVIPFPPPRVASPFPGQFVPDPR